MSEEIKQEQDGLDEAVQEAATQPAPQQKEEKKGKKSKKAEHRDHHGGGSRAAWSSWPRT